MNLRRYLHGGIALLGRSRPPDQLGRLREKRRGKAGQGAGSGPVGPPHKTRLTGIVAGLLFLSPIPVLPAEVKFKQRALEELTGQLPKLLASQDKATGRFGQGIWIVTDQNAMLALAAAWSFRDAKNPYYHDRELLDTVMAAGDALIADQDPAGKWEFRKKDGSTWGKIYMPWTYSRWVRSYLLVRDAMPEDRRARWAEALKLGYEGISKDLRTARPTNIPAHQAMGLYFAGQAFEKPEWRAQASEFLKKVVAAQNPAGYWTENNGPVVLYGAVYIDALATYAAASGDASVLAALRKAAQFFTYFTYPDGSAVETIDERNPYHARPAGANVGLTYTPEGQTLLARLLRANKTLGSDLAAILLLYGKQGPALDRDPVESDCDYTLGDGEAAVRRRGPWYMVISALTSTVSKNRWFMDRQNLISVYHDRVGLILGGGNSKLQPQWSTRRARGDLPSDQ